MRRLLNAVNKDSVDKNIVAYVAEAPNVRAKHALIEGVNTHKGREKTDEKKEKEKQTTSQDNRCRSHGAKRANSPRLKLVYIFLTTEFISSTTMIHCGINKY